MSPLGPLLGFILLPCMPFIFLYKLIEALILDLGLTINLGFWKKTIIKPFDWDKYIEETTRPVTNPIHRAILERSGLNPDDYRVAR